MCLNVFADWWGDFEAPGVSGEQNGKLHVTADWHLRFFRLNICPGLTG